MWDFTKRPDVGLRQTARCGTSPNGQMWDVTKRPDAGRHQTARCANQADGMRKQNAFCGGGEMGHSHSTLTWVRTRVIELLTCWGHLLGSEAGARPAVHWEDVATELVVLAVG